MQPADVQILGEAPVFLDVLDHISRVAPLDRPVLVIGERGTGKELVAARLHFLSRRWDKSFIQMNCAALTDSLIESELFGHEAGAFTGATRARAGRFEEADSGTLFLDEIATLSMTAQEKLLRVIEYGQYQRLGSNDVEETDVRLIGATNIDLPAAVRDGNFRADLLDRLSFDVLTLPPLRARRDDIPLLAKHFGRAMANELGWAHFPGFSDRAMEALLAYDFPGNVRELKNLVERSVYRAGDTGAPVDEVAIDPFLSPYRPRNDQKPETPSALDPDEIKRGGVRSSTDLSEIRDFKGAVGDYERAILEAAMKAERHQQKATADRLGLTYDQLRHALKKHNLLSR
ncbi:MAG: phage shock protein operon transcriptional activator [Pseudomonadota bacterium]